MTTIFKKLYQAFYAAAVELLDRPPVTYQKEGRRLLSVCQICESRVILLSLIYRISGEDRFLKRAEEEMLAAAAFPDWNPDHYLDTGEMTAALGIGLDWLHSELSPETREIIADAIYEKGLRTLYLEDGTMRNVMFTNWTQVCYGGLSIGRTGDRRAESPDGRGDFNLAANRTTQLVEGWYSPEGAYVEGPGYWDYGTSFHVMLIDALASPRWDPISIWELSPASRNLLSTGWPPADQPASFSIRATAIPMAAPIRSSSGLPAEYKMRGDRADGRHRKPREGLRTDSRDNRLAPLILAVVGCRRHWADRCLRRC